MLVRMLMCITFLKSHMHKKSLFLSSRFIILNIYSVNKNTWALFICLTISGFTLASASTWPLSKKLCLKISDLFKGVPDGNAFLLS